MESTNKNVHRNLLKKNRCRSNVNLALLCQERFALQFLVQIHKLANKSLGMPVCRALTGDLQSIAQAIYIQVRCSSVDLADLARWIRNIIKRSLLSSHSIQKILKTPLKLHIQK